MMIVHSGRRSICDVVILLYLGAGPVALAQTRPVHRIDSPDRVAPDQFSLIKGLRELSDGRVIVSDWIEERVTVVDFEAGTARDLGRVGSGPNEFRLPSRLLALPGDSTLLLDYGNARLIVIGPQLNFVRSFPTRAHGERYSMNPSATDHKGVLYFALPAWARGPDAPRMDSIPIGSWAPGYATVRLIANVQMKGSTPRERKVSLKPGIPFKMFAKQDGWTVTRDGWLAVVRSEPYRVDWYGPQGEQVVGPAIDYGELPVTMDDRRNYVRRFLMSSAQSGRGEDGGMGHVPSEGQSEKEINRLAESEEFAEAYPPFEPGRVWSSDDGRLWAQRALPADSDPKLDVFERSGKRIATVMLPSGREVVGFGSATLYATVADDFGLLTLERYRLPTKGS